MLFLISLLGCIVVTLGIWSWKEKKPDFRVAPPNSDLQENLVKSRNPTIQRSEVTTSQLSCRFWKYQN